LEIANINAILNSTGSGEAIALLAEFKISLNTYLKDLVASPVRTLADVIAFNHKFADLVSIWEQVFFQFFVYNDQYLSYVSNSKNA
jgi:amidase